MATNSILAKLQVLIGANAAQFLSELNKTHNKLGAFTSGITKIAGALGIAFGVQQIASFTLEVSRLSGEANAVRTAFERLPESTKLMGDLKRATGGTVSELELMKRAVQASNFDISLSALPRLLEFATLRAQQTGQSVDYLVDSIVTGIGRKSKLILDNLGISAVQLTEALGGASAASSSIGEVADAVGRIAEENLRNMASFSENASTKLQRLAASWDNLKVSIGDSANSTGILGKSVDALTAGFDLLSSRQLSFFEKLAAFGGGPGAAAAAVLEDIKRKQEQVNREQRRQENIIKQVDKAFVKFKGNIDEFAKAISPTHPLRGAFLEEFQRRLVDSTKESIKTYADLRAEITELNTQFETATSRNDRAALTLIGDKIIAINAEIEALDKLRKAEKERKDPLDSKFQFIPDLEAEGSLNPELRNDQARNEAIEFANALNQVATSAEFAGGAVIQLEEATGEAQVKMREFIDISSMISGGLADIATGLGRAATGAQDFGASILGALASFMQQFGAGLIAIGIGKIALEKFSGPAMVAAGFALSAAGAALSTEAEYRARKFGESPSSGGGVALSTASRFRANTSVQDSSPQLVTVLKGEDVWIMLQNYQQNNRFTGG